MKRAFRLAVLLLHASVATVALAQEEIPDVFADPTIDFFRPADRARAMKRIEAIENARLQNARARGRAMGLPLRVEKPGGGVQELIDFRGAQPVYLETKNANAAISTAADLVQTSPYMLDGSGLTVGVWDAAGGRPTHQEFATGSRLTNMNGTTTNYHSMHVAGTIAALGVDAPSRGMANAARIKSYDWNSDLSEMGTAGATAPGQDATKLYLSNHSYGTADGWNGSTWTGSGTDQNAYTPAYGQYGTAARDMDSTAYNTPYLLSFWAAGNERDDNPSSGASVVINGATVSYDPAIHPPGDGKYRNGYETISYRGLAKNVVTVGAVNDAVTAGVRDLAKATICTFSSTGPTDDGRIKPDLVANGFDLKSTDIDNDADYRNLSGTSMASPNACGSATLLVDQYNRLFGSAMRASTLKALLIHTADDIGNPGPDYFYGWGLIDVKEAADLLIDHKASPNKQRLTEDQVSTTVTSRAHSFIWDGVSPIKATLAWTDPAGTSTSAHDSRTPTLRNNLNLKLISPDGTEHLPFVMPFVGTWTVASMSENATTGINHTDNVEQVLVTNPGGPGVWQAVVSYSGSLTNSLQNYGLIISGSANQNLPLAINSITPAGGVTNTIITADITGTNLSTDTTIRLKQAGRADIIGTSVGMIDSATLRCQFNLTGAASGLWSVHAANPDTETFTLPGAFTVSGILSTFWSENFDGTVTGWTSQSTSGGNSWTVSTAQSHSPAKSYFALGPNSSSTTYLVSPPVDIPSDPINLQIEFWHSYNLQSQRDGGRFSLSLDNGVTWFDVNSANSGAAFTGNGYNTTMASTGRTSEFAGLQAWSGNSNGFIRTVVSLNDIPKYAGKNLRMRWGIATNNQTSSSGWYVDSIALFGESGTPNQAPVVTVAASTSSTETQTAGPTVYQIIRGTGTGLAVTATDDTGEAELTYTWSSSGPAPVFFNVNGTNASKNTAVAFQAVGDYAITATVTDSGGLSAASTVNVRVLPAASLRITPASALVQYGTTRQFSAVLEDQFGAALASQPSTINWSANGGGTMDGSGLFSATMAGGPFEVTASSSPYSGSASVTVNPAPVSITFGNLFQTYDGNPKQITVNTGETTISSAVTYDNLPDAPVNAGIYQVHAIITDPNYEGSAAGTLVIDKASQTITFAPLAPAALGDAAITLAATASSGLTVSYSNSDPSVAAISGNTVTLVGPGTTTLTASQAGDANHHAAPGVSQQLTVAHVIPLLAWDSDAGTAGQTDGAGAWLDSNMWWNGSANVTWPSGSDAVFGHGGAGGAVGLASPTTVNTLTFDTFTGTYTLGTAGQSLTIRNGLTLNPTAAAVSLRGSPIVLGADQTWTHHSSSALTVTGEVNNGGHFLTLDGGGTTSFGPGSNSIITGSGGIIKTGSGILILSADNTYTGATTVNDGTLRVNSPGSLAAGSATSVNGGTLGGDGTIHGSVTVAADGNIAPGAPVGTLAIGGGLDLSAMAAGAGTLEYDLNSLAETNDKISIGGTLTIGTGALGFDDFVFTHAGGLQTGVYKLITTSGGIIGGLDSANASGVITGALNPASAGVGTNDFTGTLRINGGDLELVVSMPPTLVGITDDSGGGTVSIHTPVTCTVAFDMDMDADTVGVEDFGNAGTSAITIGTITETTPGVFSIQVTPTNAGTLQLRINQGAIIASAAGDELDTSAALPDDTTLNVQTAYAIWAGGVFQNPLPDPAADANPDSDTLNNLQEFAFGTDPTVSSTGPITYAGGVVTARGEPVVIEQGGVRYAVFGRRVDHAAAGLDYAVRFSADLEPGYWETSDTVPAVLATDGVIEAVAVPYPGPVPTSSGPRDARFFQVGVSGNH
jgi:autotransporter-associated beta strand protein